MERREIEIFLVLAGELHFGRTAERLRVSQARVSQTVKKLERQVGAPLFERTSRKVDLTPLGRQLRDDIEPAYRQIEAGIARAIGTGKGAGGLLRVGFEAPALSDLVLDVLDAFRGQQPDCEIQIREADFTDPFALLRSGDVDVLITLLPIEEEDLTVGPVVYTEPMVLAVSSRHPFARREWVTLEDLARDTVFRAARPSPPYWRDPGEPWNTPEGKPIRRGHTVSTFQELLTVIASGTGICPLAGHAEQYFARPKVAFVPFRDSPPAEWSLVWRTAGETSRIRAFTKAAEVAVGAR